jgi:cell division inhibitor SepF
MATMWKRTLAYLGLVEDYDDEYVEAPDESAPARPSQSRSSEARSAEFPARPEPSNVRRLGPRSSEVIPPVPTPLGAMRTVPSGKVHVTNPTTFNDVEEVGDRFRSDIPVIMNLDGASEMVAKRLLDFASGLIYGLDGRIERVGDRVFLLTPKNVDVSTEERRRLSERGFFNQE